MLLYLFPAFSALLSPGLAGDRFTRRDWLLITTACLGAAQILWSGQLSGGLTWGHLLGLAASFCLGLTFTLIRKASDHNNPMTPFFYICAAGIAVSLGPALLQPGGLAITVRGLSSLFWVAVLATAAHLAGNQALTYLSSPRVGVILTSEVVFGAIIGLLVFEEPVSLRTGLGGLLIIGSGIGFNIGNQKS